MQSRFRLNIPLSYTIRHCPEILVGDPMLSPESQSVTHNRTLCRYEWKES